MPYDLIIHGGRVVEPDGDRQVSIAVENGKIVEVSADLKGNGIKEIEAEGCLILPGTIDTHVHFNDPGRADWEGIPSGSQALASGGGTCFIDMPLNASPPTLDGPSFDAKAAAASGSSYTDYAFWGGLVPGNEKHLPELAQKGVVGFKAFFSHSGMEDFPHSDEKTLLEAMKIAASLNLPVAVHAEDEGMVSRLMAEAKRKGACSLLDFFHSRPVEAELAAIDTVIQLAADAGCRVHIVHVSHPEGVRKVAEAKSAGLDVTCETCPHYLLLSEEKGVAIGAAAKCAPPLREEAALEALWDELINGSIDWIASDHSPSLPDMKLGQDFFAVWGGISSCQSTLPLLFAEGHDRRGISLVRLASLIASVPAKYFRLPDKGCIAAGYDADLVIINPGGRRSLSQSDLLYRHKITPYLGYPIHGLVKQTLLRGEPTDQPRGKLLRPDR